VTEQHILMLMICGTWATTVIFGVWMVRLMRDISIKLGELKADLGEIKTKLGDINVELAAIRARLDKLEIC
jgi:hypothetical protein